MPGDRLALAVLVRGEQQLVCLVEQFPQLAYLLLLIRVDHVQRLEPGVDVDAEPCPRLLLVLGRYVGRLVWQVTDVTDARLDHVTAA